MWAIACQAAHMFLLEMINWRSHHNHLTTLIDPIKVLKCDNKYFTLQYLNLYSLYCWRQRGDLIEVYKLINHLNRVSPDPFFTLANSVTRGHDYRIFKQHCRTTSRLKFFTNRIVNQWNSLPQHVITSDSLNKFKNNLDQYWYKIRYGQTKRPLAY